MTFSNSNHPAENARQEAARFVNLCPVFLSADVKRTVAFYTQKLGFRAARHYDKAENFATLYRDEIEFVIIQAQKGIVESNTQRYGVGYDAYIDTVTPEGVDPIYEEYKAKGVKILVEPYHTAYGSYEFVIEDCDGRQIGIGRIHDNSVYFKNADPGTPA